MLFESNVCSGGNAGSGPVPGIPRVGNGGCAACLLPICDPYFHNVNEKNWHCECTKCSVCKKQLDMRCMTRDGLLFCREDYNKFFGPKCATCRESIAPTEMVHKLKHATYHLRCLHCHRCHVALGVGETVAILDNGALLCAEDYRRMVASLHQQQQQDPNVFGPQTISTVSADNVPNSGPCFISNNPTANFPPLSNALPPKPEAFSIKEENDSGVFFRQQQLGSSAGAALHPPSATAASASRVGPPPVMTPKTPSYAPGDSQQHSMPHAASFKLETEYPLPEQSKFPTNPMENKENHEKNTSQQQSAPNQILLLRPDTSSELRQQSGGSCVPQSQSNPVMGMDDTGSYFTDDFDLPRSTSPGSRTGEELLLSNCGGVEEEALSSVAEDDEACESRAGSILSEGAGGDGGGAESCSNDAGNSPSAGEGGGNSGLGGKGGNGGGGCGGTKRRGPRTTIKAKQLDTLKAAFSATPKPTRHVREQLAQETGLSMRVIQVWFQNRRSKERRMKQLNLLGSRRPPYFRSARRIRSLRPGLVGPEDMEFDPAEMMNNPLYHGFLAENHPEFFNAMAANGFVPPHPALCGLPAEYFGLPPHPMQHHPGAPPQGPHFFPGPATPVTMPIGMSAGAPNSGCGLDPNVSSAGPFYNPTLVSLPPPTGPHPFELLPRPPTSQQQQHRPSSTGNGVTVQSTSATPTPSNNNTTAPVPMEAW